MLFYAIILRNFGKLVSYYWFSSANTPFQLSIIKSRRWDVSFKWKCWVSEHWSITCIGIVSVRSSQIAFIDQHGSCAARGAVWFARHLWSIYTITLSCIGGTAFLWPWQSSLLGTSPARPRSVFCHLRQWMEGCDSLCFVTSASGWRGVIPCVLSPPPVDGGMWFPVFCHLRQWMEGCDSLCFVTSASGWRGVIPCVLSPPPVDGRGCDSHKCFETKHHNALRQSTSYCPRRVLAIGHLCLVKIWPSY